MDADHDTLDLSGDWRLTLGYNIGVTVDPSGHWAPIASPRTYGVHFDAVGPGDHGGTKYKGVYITTLPGTEPEDRGEFFAETFYNGRGVQLVQMFFVYEPFRYFDLFSGKHELYSTDPTRIEVLGGWVNVGNPTGGRPGGSGYIGNFVMAKAEPEK